MAEGITTLYNVQQEQEQSLAPELNDLLYLMHGTGSDRDRVFTLYDVFLVCLGGILNVDPTQLSSLGDIKFVTTSTSGGNKLSAEIIDGKIDESKLKSILDLINNKLRWLDTLSNKMQLDFSGLKFFEHSDTNYDGNGKFRFSRDGMVKGSKLIFPLNSSTQTNISSHRTMKNCEGDVSTEKTLITDYLTVSTTNRPEFKMDSEIHEIGSIIAVSNESTTADQDIICIPAWYSSGSSYESEMIAKIPPQASRLFIYKGLKNVGGTNYPDWRALS